MSQIHCNEKIDFNKAINDEDITKICMKAASSFSNCLSPEEIKNCIHSAIWSASLNFKPEKNTKFTTYLYRGVVHECLKCKKMSAKKISCVPVNNNLLSGSFNNFSKIDLIDEIKVCSEPDILIDRFFYNFTLNEMAKKRGVSKETIRFKLRKNLDFLKTRLSKSV